MTNATEKKGKVSGWQDAKGFGFILPDDGSARVFIHYSALAPDQARPRNGDAVRYLEAVDDKGRASAKKVWTRSQTDLLKQRRDRIKVSERAAKSQEHSEKDLQAVWIVIPFLLGLLVLALLRRIPTAVVGVYVAVSLIAFVVYWRDKRAALENAWRTQESTLHLLGVLGGWPGALLAQRLFRHKSGKQEFRLVFWVTVLINVTVLVIFVTKLSRA